MKKASAPAKVHLIGEHAVVYGEPAIFAAVGMRTFVTAKKSRNVKYLHSRWGHNDFWDLEDVLETTQKILDLWQKSEKQNNFSPLFENIKANSYENYKKSVAGIIIKNLDVEGIEVKIDSKIPPGAGLGSSASMAVAAVQAVAEEYGKKSTKEEINNIAYEIEKLIHGTPSGGDNSACCYGGMLWFVKGEKPLSLKKEIPYTLENFMFVYTEKPRKNTGELVQAVRNLPEHIRTEKIKSIGKAAREMREALKKKDTKKLKDLINFTQNNLQALGVSTEKIDVLTDEIVSIGGAAKLCGAGGGGIVLCYHEDKEKLKDIITSLGYDPWEADLAVEGVRVES